MPKMSSTASIVCWPSVSVPLPSRVTRQIMPEIPSSGQLSLNTLAGRSDCAFRLEDWDLAIARLDAFIKKSAASEPNRDTAMIELALARAGMACDFVALDQLMRRYVHPLYAIRERSRGYEVSIMKAAMEILGMPAGPVRPPLPDCDPQDLADLRALMDVYRSYGRESLRVAGD